ncbi:hypothetical protein [Pararhizobium sp.]|nr:hypothetical protein [Pararhizobium sp.]
MAVLLAAQSGTSYDDLSDGIFTSWQALSDHLSDGIQKAGNFDGSDNFL